MISLAGLLVFSLIFQSCQKEEKTMDDPAASGDNALAEALFNDAGNIVDEAFSKTVFYKSSEMDDIHIGACASIVLDTVSEPHQLIVDFGEENCLCNDGKYRRGKIMVSFTGRYPEEGTVLIHTYDDYFVNDNQVSGSRVVTNMGMNPANHLYFTVIVDGQIIKSDGNIILWQSDRIREWVEGSETWTLWDDIYHLSGTVDGVAANGKAYHLETITPLRKEIGCPHFVSGILEMQIDNKPTITIDYGDGDCDNLVMVTINGRTYKLKLS